MKRRRRERCAIYVRVSTTKQETANQLAQLRRFAASQRWTVAHVYRDEESAATGRRAAFLQMFDAASRREFDVLLFWSLDRLTREGALATLRYLDTLTSYGIGYRSFTEQYLDSCGPFRDGVIAILGVIAKQERIRMGERTKAGLTRARDKGKTLGRPKKQVPPETIDQAVKEKLSYERAAALFRRRGVRVSPATARRLILARLKAKGTNEKKETIRARRRYYGWR